MSSLRWLIIFLGMVLVACSQEPDTGTESGQKPDKTAIAKPEQTLAGVQKGRHMLMLSYAEQEPGIEPYLNRILITPDFMRMDDGVDQSDFTLFDRNKKIIYSISHETRTTLVLREQVSDIKSPVELKLGEQQVDMIDAPAIEDRKPLHYRLLVNDQLCRETIVVPGLHAEALRALREFRQVLASVHKENVNKTPDDMQDPCFLADDIFWPNRSLKFGFPVNEWTPGGFSRSLIDYKYNVPVSEGVFEIPEGYLRKSMTGELETDT